MQFDRRAFLATLGTAAAFNEMSSEALSCGIRYHQALRSYPDPSVGYEYPEAYNQIFGKDYVPPPYVKQALSMPATTSRTWTRA